MAQTNYVSLHGAHIAPFTSWATAATNIQDAVDVAQDGDLVLVSNGLYNSGSRVTPNAHLHSRVVITNAITVQSLNGPDVTVIVGAADPETGARGSNAVRGVCIGSGASMFGFTVSNGYVSDDGNAADLFGAGVFVFDSSSLVGCRISHNYGGFAAGLCCVGSVLVENCVFSHNLGFMLAGCYANTGYFRNALVVSNGYPHQWLPMGLGPDYGAIESSTICDNTGSAIDIGPTVTVANCTIWGHHYQIYESGTHRPDRLTYNSCIQDWTRLDHGTISNDPQFVDAVAGDFRLLDTSPCINAGTNMSWMWTATDLDGNPRIQHGVVDMGCYESAVPEPGAIALAALVAMCGRRKRHEA